MSYPDWLIFYHEYARMEIPEEWGEKEIADNSDELMGVQVTRHFFRLYDLFKIKEGDPRDLELHAQFNAIMDYSNGDFCRRHNMTVDGKIDGNKPPKPDKKKRGAPSDWPEHKKFLKQEDWDFVADLDLIEARDRLVDIMSERYFDAGIPSTKRMTKRARRRNIENELKSRR